MCGINYLVCTRSNHPAFLYTIIEFSRSGITCCYPGLIIMILAQKKLLDKKGWTVKDFKREIRENKNIMILSLYLYQPHLQKVANQSKAKLYCISIPGRMENRIIVSVNNPAGMQNHGKGRITSLCTVQFSYIYLLYNQEKSTLQLIFAQCKISYIQKRNTIQVIHLREL